MPYNGLLCMITQDSQCSGGVKNDGGQNGGMGKEERRARILAVLEDTGCAMKGVDVWRNAKLRGAEFERRTTANYLTELMETGDVVKVDTDDLDSGTLTKIDRSERGHFMAASAYEELHDSE